jgi:zinc D-Ala-D-Ala carboxypeptidase
MTDDLVLPNFKLDDFRCHCEDCAHDPDRPSCLPEVMGAVQAVRDLMGKPLRLTRGVSCKKHNQAVGGAPDSRHLPEHRDAVDLACADSQEAFEIVAAVICQHFFTTIRVYPHHVHVDARPGPFIFIASPAE